MDGNQQPYRQDRGDVGLREGICLDRSWRILGAGGRFRNSIKYAIVYITWLAEQGFGAYLLIIVNVVKGR